MNTAGELNCQYQRYSSSAYLKAACADLETAYPSNSLLASQEFLCMFVSEWIAVLVLVLYPDKRRAIGSYSDSKTS